MSLARRNFLRMAASAAIAPATASHTWAQFYPARAVTMIVPFPAGGSADPIARIVAEHMRASLGQTIVAENVTGANGNIGTARVARAPADGYTLGIGLWNTHVGNAALSALPYDVVNDFEPVALLGSFPMVIVARKSMAANNLQELIAWLKANPGKASQGSAGAGGLGHVTGAYFQAVTGTRFQHVPYRGSAPAMQDLVSEHIDLMIDTPPVCFSQLRAGNIKAYAVMRATRLPAAPTIPTVDEAGVPGLYSTNWVALFAPKAAPKDVIGKLNAAVQDALADQTVRGRIDELGYDIPPRAEQSPEALAALQKADIAKWLPIIKASGIKTE